MKLEQTFEIAAPLEDVWRALIDLERVAPCLPGAAITGRDDDGVYHGTFVIKLGPATASYTGTVRLEHIDEATHTATLNARGTDKRGQGGAAATIVNRLSASDAGTSVQATTDMTITGRLARFGRPGMMQDISNRMLGEFASCLQERLVSGGGAAAGAPAAAGALAGPTPDPVAAESVGGSTAPDLAADLAAEGREASRATPMASTPTGAPTGMAGGALSTPPATDPAAGVSGTRDPETVPPPPTPPAIEAAPPVQGLSVMAGVASDVARRNAASIGAALVLLLLLLVFGRRRR